MKRTDFLKALAVVPFVPSVLKRLKPAPGFANIPTPQPATYLWEGVAKDESWVVEFAGATFYLDAPGSPASATAPFECRMGVDHLENGWKRLWVSRDCLTYSCKVRRWFDDVERAALALEGAPQGVITLVTPQRIR